MLLKAISLFLAVAVLIVLPGASFAENLDEEGGRVLNAAEFLFKSMKERQYREIWGTLSLKSQEIIVGNVRKDALRGGCDYSPDQIRTDFSIGGMLSRTYWSGFLKVFDPDEALEQSRWELKQVNGSRAEIHLLNGQSSRPAELKLFKEGGAWKVGLEETFGVRRWFLR